MALFLNEDDVRQLLTMPLTIEAVEESHKELSLARAIDIPRQRTRLPQTALHILQGALPGRDAIGYKAYTSNRSGIRFLVHVFSAASGALRVVMEADYLGMMRTGAASGVATRWLARPDAEVLGVFGAGWQAEGNIEAVATVRKLRKVKVFARNAERLAAFCTKMVRSSGNRCGSGLVSRGYGAWQRHRQYHHHGQFAAVRRGVAVARDTHQRRRIQFVDPPRSRRGCAQSQPSDRCR